MRLRKACLLALVCGSRNSEFRGRGAGGRGGRPVPDLDGWGRYVWQEPAFSYTLRHGESWHRPSSQLA